MMVMPAILDAVHPEEVPVIRQKATNNAFYSLLLLKQVDVSAR